MEINTEDCTGIFHLNENGTTTIQTYMGTFKVKCILNPMDFMAADKLYRELLGDIHPETAHGHTKSVAFSLSQLKYRIIEAPAFWDNRELGGSHLKDDSIIVSVLNMAMDIERKYRATMVKEAERRQEELTDRIRSKAIEKEEVIETKDEEDIAAEKLKSMDEKDGVELDD